MLDIKNLNIKVNKKEIIENVSLNVKEGEIHLIVGPNGAGKSTLAKGILKHPQLEIKGSIHINEKDFTNSSTADIANAGVFLSHQTPVEIPGIKYLDFLRLAYNNSRSENERIDLWTFVDIFNENVKKVGLPDNFIDRELNAGFSGGEKKKSEILQLLILEPKYAILDEIDSGLDIDSTKNIYNIINELKDLKKTGFIVITHNIKIFDYITPTQIHLLKNGKIERSGGKEIINSIAEEGFNHNE